MYTDTTFLTTYTKCLLDTIFASDMVLKVYVHTGTNMFSSWTNEPKAWQYHTNSTSFYLQLVQISLNKWIRLHTQLIINARFGVLPFLLTFNLKQYYCYTTSLADNTEFKVQNMYKNTLASRISYRQTSSVIEIEVEESGTPFSHFAQQT